MNGKLKKKFPSNHALRNLRYLDYPQKFTWKPKPQEWSVRKKGNTIGRIYAISTKKHELFHLRLLLLNVHEPERSAHF